ncbi:hypothetical protein LXA43DRAFT_1090991 [Ganoderma leucocontextum]|nr:hypothetical protein LXA43DRAFT_1090991 [Ganoderma leucocontextum]
MPRMNSLRIPYVCPSLSQLFTALVGPVLASASFHAICDDRRTERPSDYVSCIKALATVGSPATMEDLCIKLDEDGGLPQCGVLLQWFVADHGGFWAITRPWPRLQAFELWPAYWDPSVDLDGEDSEGIPIPTPEILQSFREHAPDLEDSVMLPHLDFDANVPARYIPDLDRSCHGLERLSFGAKDLGGEHGEDWDRELTELDDSKVVDALMGLALSESWEAVPIILASIVVFDGSRYLAVRLAHFLYDH